MLTAPRPLVEFQETRSACATVSFSADGSLVTCAGPSGGSIGATFFVVEVATLARRESPGERPGMRPVAFSPDGTLIACGSRPHELRLLSTESLAEVATIAGHHDWLSSVAFSPDGKHVASASKGGVLIHDVTGALVKSITHKSIDGWVPGLVFSKDGTLYVGGGTLANAWTLSSTEPLRSFAPKKKGYSLSGLALSPDGSLLAGCRHFGPTTIWDASTAELRVNFDKHDARAIAFSPDGRLAALDGKGRLCIYDPTKLAKGTELEEVKIEVDPADSSLSTCSLAFSPDGTLLACGHARGALLIDVGPWRPT